jgi:hypothetical protein
LLADILLEKLFEITVEEIMIDDFLKWEGTRQLSDQAVPAALEPPFFRGGTEN